MSIKHPYGEYIPLREAFALIGPSVVFGWKGNELDLGIWRDTALRRRQTEDQNRFSAREKYRRLGSWFLSAVQAGEIELFRPDDENPPLQKIDPTTILAWWTPTAFSGHLTMIPVEEQLAGAVISENAPVVYVDADVVERAAQRFLSSDDSLYWSLSQAAYWIATGRPEIVRELQRINRSDFEAAFGTDLRVPVDEARGAIWAELEKGVENGGLALEAVPEAGPQKGEIVSPVDLRRLRLELQRFSDDVLVSTIDGKIIYRDPTVSREAIIQRWPPISTSSGPDRASILTQLESGRLSIDEAEALAGGALAQEPSKKGFELKAERDWTIPMVLAGMTSDNEDDVIEQMNDWRKLVRHYYINGERVTAASLAKIRKERGHRVSVRRLEPAGFWLLMHGPRQEDYGEAWAILRDRLGAATVEAHGVNQSKKQRERIEAYKWPHLVAHGSDTWDGLNGEHYTEPGKDLERYSDIQIARSAMPALRNAFKKVPATERLTREEREKCDTIAREAFDLRVKGWPRTGPFPTTEGDFAFMCAAIEKAGVLPKHKAVPREMLRVIRREILPAHNYSEADWSKKGQRKKSAE